MAHSDRIAGYNVLAVLGYGASSTIYAVQRPRDQQVFALKRVVRAQSSDQKFVDQAVNEYEIASRIDHPTIRKVYKLKRRRVFLMTSEVFILMELVDGRNLVQQRPPLLADLVKVFAHVADGMGVMHKSGYVHADMKPNNLLLTETGEVKIIDFGQSCRVGTIKSRIQGTPDYIAPEQVKRRPLTPRTDIFNFGATMYWCVTDRHVPTLIPKTENEVALKTDMEVKPPTEFNPGLPFALNNLIMSCLKYRPDDRPESMAEVKARLEVAIHQIDREQTSA
jgi:serine/threonine protein kinase